MWSVKQSSFLFRLLACICTLKVCSRVAAGSAEGFEQAKHPSISWFLQQKNEEPRLPGRVLTCAAMDTLLCSSSISGDAPQGVG